jgi:L-methionine (R)-S-oxide reductase
MFQKQRYTGSREENYELVIKQLKALLEGEKNRIANLANAASLLSQFLSDINWVGFYLISDGELVLGPFQGLPACTRIPIGKGVCGTAAKDRKVLCVDDVEKFPGHIACDAASKSEIVLPLIKNHELIGVLDIDSPKLKRFDAVDSKYLKMFSDLLVLHL